MDFFEQWPWLKSMQKPATRFRPQPASGIASAPGGTRIGGLPGIPAGEPWPLDSTGRPLVFVLQLNQSDAPFLPFPAGTDLLQIFWRSKFPFEEQETTSPGHSEWDALMPAPRLFWRQAATLAMSSTAPCDTNPQLTPVACVCDPEQFLDLPDRNTLVRQRLAPAGLEWIESYAEIPVGQGTKAGGWPFWLQMDQTPRCAAGHTMQHLVTIASCEFLGPRGCRWDYLRSETKPVREGLQIASRTGLELHDCGQAYFFDCRECADRPVKWVFQSF